MKIEKAISKEIKNASETLSKKFGAKMVILFGSHAYGHPDLESDLDICVILNLSGKRKIEVMREIRRELTDSVSSPLDILIYEESEFGERANLSSTLEHKILKQGIKIYEQPGYHTGVV